MSRVNSLNRLSLANVLCCDDCQLFNVLKTSKAAVAVSDPEFTEYLVDVVEHWSRRRSYFQGTIRLLISSFFRQGNALMHRLWDSLPSTTIYFFSVSAEDH